jgi:predicted MFS family arabinose efflux permease
VADITEPKDRARAFGLIGAAFGLGFIFGPAISGVLAKVSYTAPIWAAAAITAVAMMMAFVWLPETVHRTHAGTGNPLRYLPELLRRPIVTRVLIIDFFYWFSFAVFQATFALFVAKRFNYDAPRTGYLFAGFGIIGVLVQATLIRPIVRRLGDKPTFVLGLAFTIVGLLAAAASRSVTMFVVSLLPLAIGMGCGTPTISSLVSRSARRDEQGRVQGAASAVESLGRAVGPIWGTGSMQRFGDSMPYLSAAAFALLTLMLSIGYRVADAEPPLGPPVS